PAGSEFNVDWRAINAALGKVNLNRYLTPYPSYSDSTHSMLTTSSWSRYDDNPQVLAQFQQAQSDRQQFASDIYTRLIAVTGLNPNPSFPGPTDTNVIPYRWLAQLAANIVDFIDPDDISTPFNFYPAGTSAAPPAPPGFWVFGTELPHVVL